jgi:hypothetical protein
MTITQVSFWRHLLKLLDKAVKFLTTYLSDDVKDKVRVVCGAGNTQWLSEYHFGWGMGIRNALRQAGLSDAQLPDQNWDDYYGAVVEIVCGLRPMPGGNNESQELAGIPANEETKGWYIIEMSTNEPGAGPYVSSKAARHTAKFKHWYSPNEWDIRYGYVNAEDQFVELPKPKE